MTGVDGPLGTGGIRKTAEEGSAWQHNLHGRCCVARQIASIRRTDNVPSSQPSSSFAACPAAANTASVAGKCDADTVSEAGGAILALARGLTIGRGR